MPVLALVYSIFISSVTSRYGASQSYIYAHNFNRGHSCLVLQSTGPPLSWHGLSTCKLFLDRLGPWRGIDPRKPSGHWRGIDPRKPWPGS